jgi:hypothetical protein
VLVRVVPTHGADMTFVLRSDAPSIVLPAAQGSARVLATYARLGVRHVLSGFDHLLFVLGLVLLVRSFGAVVRTVTAFTVGHSITLALATLGVLGPPQAPIEAAIALSIALVASEIVAPVHASPSFTREHPWSIAGAFGLLHGFGFAGALRDVGLPAHDVPVALLAFNAGVELGQLVFVAAAVGAIKAAGRAPWRWPRRARTLVPYAMGSVAMFWCFERIAAFW